jgi:hypothetical protein
MHRHLWDSVNFFYKLGPGSGFYYIN